MRVIGLTGGIASGKSTVQHILQDLGATVLDADIIYHQLLLPDVHGTPSTLTRHIMDTFGHDLLLSQGELNRHALATRIFANAALREKLNHLTHHEVLAALACQLEEKTRADLPLVICSIPLLYEVAFDKTVSGVVLVWVPENIQLERLMTRNHFSEEQARQRLQAQWPLDKKRRLATWVIDNSGNQEATKQQVERLWVTLQP